MISCYYLRVSLCELLFSIGLIFIIIMSKQVYRKPLIGFAEQVVDCEVLLSQSKEDLTLLKKLISLIVV